MRKLVVDTLTLRDLTAGTGLVYSVTGVQGLEAPEYRVGSYDRPGEDGSRVTTAFYSARLVTLNGDMQAPDGSVVTQETARQALAYAFRIQRDKYNYPTPTVVQVTTLDGGTYTLSGVVKSFKNELKYPTYSSWIAQLVCPDPAVYGTSLQTTGQIGIQVGGGAAFPLVFPITFAAGTGGTALLALSGNMNSWPLIYLRGALTNPRVYSVETGGLVQLAYSTTNATDVIVVDMANKTVMLNGATNLQPYLSTDSTWFSVLPQTNTFLFSTSSAGDTGTVEVVAYPAFLGV